MKRTGKMGLFLAMVIITVCSITAHAITYTYDPLNRLTGVAYDNGTSIGYTYDAAGNITQIAKVSSIPEQTLPGAPTGVSATAGDAQATVSFTIPSNTGGSAITSYTVTSNPGNITVGGSVSPITVTGLSNGTAYTFTVTATNATGSGPASTASNSVTPIAPPTPINGVCGSSSGQTFTIAPTTNLCSIGIADTVTGTGPWNWNCKGSNNGTTASCSATKTTSIDTAAPTLTLSTLADNTTTTNPTLNVAGTVTDSGSGVKSLTINGQTVTLATDGSFSTAITLVDGPNTVTTVATDNADNTKTDTRTITLDRTAPGLTISAPADNSVTAQTFVDVTGSVDDSTATVTAKVNNGSAATATKTGTSFSATLNLISGLNTIDITATDLAGNSTSAKRTVTSDPIAPTLAITIPAQDITTTESSITISGTVTDSVTSATISITADGQTYAPTVAADGSFSQIINLATDKTYAVVVTATDQAGNPATAQRNIIKQSGQSVSLKGDVNNDNKIDIFDALLTLQYGLNLIPHDATSDVNYLAHGDVAPLDSALKPKGDSKIDIMDALVILQRSVNLLSW